MHTQARTSSWRALTVAVALLLSLGMVPGLITAHRASAQADVSISQSDYDDLVTEATAGDPAYGPEDGDLDLDPDRVTFSTADIEPSDFYVEATFQNPYADTTAQFDYGFQFRSGEDAFLRFIVISDGTWGITDGTEDVLTSGTYDNLDATRSGENKLSVYADGGTVHVAINDDYVGSASTDVTAEGKLSVGTSFLPDSIVEGETTSFTAFQVWELGGGGLGPSKTKTPSKKTPTPTEIDGTQYESPTYGYTVVYDDTWEVSSDDTADDQDDFRITNGTSSLQFLGMPYEDTPEDCISDALDEIDSDSDMTNVSIAVDADDNELQGTLDDGTAYVVVNLTYQDTDLTAYYQCTTIEEGVSVLKVTQVAAADAYNDEIEARAKVLDSISIDGSGSSPDATETPQEEDTPQSEDTPQADETASELPPGSVVVYLEPAVQDGPVVLASLIPAGSRTQVQLFVLAVDATATYAVTFNQGSCNRPGEVFVDVGETDNQGFVDEKISERVEDLASGHYILVLTDIDSGEVVACGDPSQFVE